MDNDLNVNEKDFILSELEPMFNEARAHGLWFYCSHQELWFSPDELHKAQDNGRFVWGPDNWRLAPPATQLERLKTTAKNAANAAAEFELRMHANTQITHKPKITE